MVDCKEGPVLKRASFFYLKIPNCLKLSFRAKRLPEPKLGFGQGGIWAGGREQTPFTNPRLFLPS